VAAEGIPDRPRNGPKFEVVIFGRGRFFRRGNFHSISSLVISSLKFLSTRYDFSVPGSETLRLQDMAFPNWVMCATGFHLFGYLSMIQPTAPWAPRRLTRSASSDRPDLDVDLVIRLRGVFRNFLRHPREPILRPRRAVPVFARDRSRRLARSDSQQIMEVMKVIFPNWTLIG
jgi:hypothetical protein